MKVESLVIVDQHATVNMYLSLVLPARHTLGVACSGSVSQTWWYNMGVTPIEPALLREAPDRMSQLE